MKKFNCSLSVVALLLFSGTVIFADCPAPGTPTQELKRAAAVFSGKVVGTERRKITEADSEDFGGEQEYVKFKTIRWWKGDAAEEITLRTSRIYFRDTYKENGEGFRFSAGGSYLVFAFFYKGEYSTNDCTRTEILIKADEYLKEIGEGFPPIANSN